MDEITFEQAQKEIFEKLRKLETYEQKIPLYNLIGSEGDYNTRAIVDTFLESLKEEEFNRKVNELIKNG